MMLDDQSAKSDDEREALDFLRRGRSLHGLSPMQFRRIESRLGRNASPRRGRRWVLAFASMGLILVAGSAVAHVMDLSRLPLIGSLFPAHQSSPAPQAPRPQNRSLRASPPAAAAIGASSPAPPAVAPAPPAVAPSVPTTRTVLEHRPTAAPTAHPSRSLSRINVASGEAPTPYLANAHGPGPSREPAAPDWRAGGVASVVPPPAAWPQEPALPRSTVSSARQIQVEDPLLSESRSLSAAVAEWHRDHSAPAALAALDTHEHRFPGGQMQLEASLLRAEILLQQGREREGLALLDGLPLSGLPRGRELQTVRGELRIKYGRCPDGRRDLDHVLAKNSADDLGRRAARALALCP